MIAEGEFYSNPITNATVNIILTNDIEGLYKKIPLEQVAVYFALYSLQMENRERERVLNLNPVKVL